MKKVKFIPSDATRDFIHDFNLTYPHISHELSDKKVEEFLEQKFMRTIKYERKLDLFQDYLLANGYCDVVE